MRAILGAWLIVAVAACSGYNATGPTTSGSGNSGAYGNGGGGGTGGNTGGGAPINGDVAVIVGNNFMKSAQRHRQPGSRHRRRGRERHLDLDQHGQRGARDPVAGEPLVPHRNRAHR